MYQQQMKIRAGFAMVPLPAPALPLVGQRLLPAGRIRGNLNPIPLGPSPLGPGRLELVRLSESGLPAQIHNLQTPIGPAYATGEAAVAAMDEGGHLMEVVPRQYGGAAREGHRLGR
jgi:hypothetical protein